MQINVQNLRTQCLRSVGVSLLPLIPETGEEEEVKQKVAEHLNGKLPQELLEDLGAMIHNEIKRRRRTQQLAAMTAEEREEARMRIASRTKGFFVLVAALVVERLVSYVVLFGNMPSFPSLSLYNQVSCKPH